jgi:hypothetical protein
MLLVSTSMLLKVSTARWRRLLGDLLGVLGFLLLAMGGFVN